MKNLVPRLAALALTAAMPLVAVTLAPPAQAATSTASAAAGWLSDQLTNGVVHNAQYDFDDYGLSLDVFFALDALDTRPSAAGSIIDALEADPSAYTTGEAYGDTGSIYAGATGKLAAAVQLAGADPAAFGGRDLIGDLVSTLDADGRAKDISGFGDYSNSIGQAWGVRALATSHDSHAGDMTSFLLKQQCNNGSFRVTMSSTACTSDAGSVDGTAFAVQALLVAKAKGEAGLSDDISDAVAWLDGKQASNGSFGDDGTANTNSTGLAGATLADVGETKRAQNAAKWILRYQVTQANASGTPLSSEKGAIAFDSSAFTAGKADGITDATRDQWTRATAQAAIGVNVAVPDSSGGSASGGSSSGDGGSSGGGSDSTATSGGSPTLTPTGTPTPTETPTPSDTPTPADTPDPAATDAPVSAGPATAKTADEGSGVSAGWIVAAIAGALMLGTAGVVGIGRIRGGRQP